MKYGVITWLAILLAPANQFTDGESFYGVAPMATISFSLLGIRLLQRVTAKSDF